jgi:4-hydroxy-tetrahydrodipicolinate reductase
MRVGVLGAGGRMGRVICRAVAEDPELELVAAVDPAAAGERLGEARGIVVEAELEALSWAGAEVAVDFTIPAAVLPNLRYLSSHGIHAVVGTTGLGDTELAEAEALFRAGPPNCVVAPNFAVGAVLLARLAAAAAPYMDSAEVVEAHHDAKRDAPSGTALEIAARVAGARAASGAGPFAEDATELERLPGARGGLGPAGVRIHSVRLRGLVAHHEVIFGALGQSLTIRHDSYDRASFVPGVLLAVKSVASRPGFTLGLDRLLP